MNAFQPGVMPEDGFWRTTPRCPSRAGRSRAGKRSAQSAVKKSSCVGGRAVGAGRRVQNRIERVGHSREWVASGCAVRRTWHSGIIGYHCESPPIQRLLLIEPPGASTVGTATMIPYEIRSSGALADGYYCLIPECPPHLDFSAVGNFTDNDVTLRVNCNTVRVCQITTLVTRPPEF